MVSIYQTNLSKMTTSVPFLKRARGSTQSPQGGATPGATASSPGNSPHVVNAFQLNSRKTLEDVLDCMKDLKSDFEANNQPITDDNQTLHRFCAKLEYLLQANMKDKLTLLGRKKDYWDYFCDSIGSTKGVNDGLKYVKTIGDYKTSVGKGRAFLRFCLMHGRMADSIQQCTMNGKVTSDWFHPKSIWLQHEDRNNIISALYDLNDIQFDLAARGYDLDNAWPSFARKNLIGHGSNNWNLTSRTSSMTSLLSIPSQDLNSSRHGLSSTPNDSDLDHLTSDSMHADLIDKMEAMEQQKMSFQQSVITSQGELGLLQEHYKNLKADHEALTTDHKDVHHRFDRLSLECETREKEWQMKEDIYNKQLDSAKQETESLRSKVNSMEGKVQQLDMSRKGSDDSNMARIAELEELKMDLTLQVRTLSQDLENGKKAEEKHSDMIKDMELKLEASESKANKLLDKLKSVVENKNEAASSQMDSVSQLQSALISLKEAEEENLRLKGELLEVTNQCSQRDQELAALESKVVDLTTHRENENHTAQQKIESLQQKLETETLRTTQELKCLQDLNATIEREKMEEMAKLVNENKMSCLESETSKSDMEKVKVLASELETKLTKSEESRHFESARLQESLKHLTAENLRLQTDIESINEQVAEKESAIVEKAQKLEESQRILSEEKVRCESLHAQVKSLQGDIKGKETEIRNMIEQQSLEKGSVTEVKTALQEKMAANRELETKGRQCVQSIQWLRGCLDAGSYTKIPNKMDDVEFSNVFSEVVEKMAEKDDRMKCLESDKQSLSEQCHSLTVESEDQGRQLMNSKKDAESLKKSLLDLQEKETILKNQNSEMSENVHNLSETRDKLNESLREKETIISEREADVKNLKAEVAKLGKELNEKSATLHELQNSLSVSEEKLRQSSATQEQTSQHQNSLTEQIQSLKSQLDKQTDKANEMQSDLAKSRTKISETETKLSDLVVEKSKSDKKCENLCKRLDDLTNENQRLKKNVASATEEKQQIEQKLTEVKKSLFDSEQKLFTVRQEKEEREKGHQEVLERLQSERQDLTENLEEAMTDLGSIKLQLEQTSRELENTYHLKDQLVAERNDIISDKVTMEERITQLQTQCQGLDEEVKGQKIRVSEMTAMFDGLKAEKTGMMSEKEKVEGEIGTLQNELKDLTTERDEAMVKIDALEGELKASAEKWKENCEVLEEKQKQLEKEMNTLRDEKSELESAMIGLQNELKNNTSHTEELESLLKNNSVSLEDLEKSVSEKDKHVAELEETLKSMEENFDQERETLKQEITALQFQNSAEQIQHQQALKSYNSQETNIGELKDKLMEQEGLIEQLEQEMAEIKSAREREKDRQGHEVESLRSMVQTRDMNKGELQEKLLMSQLEDAERRLNDSGMESQSEISELKTDTEQLKKKLIKLIREKDTLWQKSDQLAYQQKEKVKEKWMDDKKVLNCLGCKTEFSFTVRKHHCRICGKIFCFNCSNNWIMTAHSSKKSRACNMCYLWHSQIESDQADTPDTENNDFEDTVELPHCKFRTSRGLSLDQEAADTYGQSIGKEPRVVVSQMNESTSTIESSEPTDQSSMEGSRTEEMTYTVPGQVATDISIALVGENETDETKVKKTVTGEEEEGAAAPSKDDVFHMISDEEISKSLTISEDSQSITMDPTLTTSLTVSTEELEKGIINSTNEVTIRAGRRFAVPIMVDKINTVLCWEFTSQPKDIVFSVTYQTRSDLPQTAAQTLVPSCKCDSHKQAVKGELTAKQLGVYTLTFDNTYSRMTPKKVSYYLWIR
ncbi:FYVE and coiled-coil domain-containing protein 1-like isoform X2 [Mizuhopecten yessoensis]|uniref:FYVE and coiled-coil domain-containing protein 1-like isoform X2 n=1 Tax=Mizuhopecten yessoensis TaxID=6573 RepID=UPI000B45DED1|nr:FYVE and coiled-coil domain-containing protein 1-like isoform X2 [Mizuhopecten yessoensis]